MAPGPYETIGLDDVLSVVADSKGCNACHDNGNPHTAKGQPQLSLPIDPFGRFGSTRHLNLRIIATDEPGRVIKTSKDFTAQSLSEVCSCIEEAVNDDLNPISGDQGRIVLKLCQALDEYQMNRGVCAGGQCP